MPNETTPTTDSATAVATAKAAVLPPAAPQTLAEKLAKMTEVKTAKVALRLMDDDPSLDDLAFTISKKAFLEAVGPSKAGTQLGVTLTLNDSFAFQGPEGRLYHFQVTCQGGWASVRSIGS